MTDYHNKSVFAMINSKRKRQPHVFRKDCLFMTYVRQPRKLSNTPAATADPITPATLGPMACISR